VSYDIAVWEGERPASDEAALETYRAMWDRYGDSGASPSERLLHYMEDLTATYPNLDDLADDAVDDSPWADGPVDENAQGSFLYFALVSDRASEVVPFVAETARRHHLVCFDPQREALL
jgi:hypothetical protein